MEEEKIKVLAFEDFLSGEKLSDIAKKYDINFNTLRSWKSRENWGTKKATKKMLSPEDNLKLMKESMITRLFDLEIDTPENINLINSYISMNNVLIELDKDIKENGVTIINSKGDKKRNESVSQYEKTLESSFKVHAKIEELFNSVMNEEDEYGL